MGVRLGVIEADGAGRDYLPTGKTVGGAGLAAGQGNGGQGPFQGEPQQKQSLQQSQGAEGQQQPGEDDITESAHSGGTSSCKVM